MSDISFHVEILVLLSAVWDDDILENFLHVEIVIWTLRKNRSVKEKRFSFKFFSNFHIFNELEICLLFILSYEIISSSSSQFSSRVIWVRLLWQEEDLWQFDPWNVNLSCFCLLTHCTLESVHSRLDIFHFQRILLCVWIICVEGFKFQTFSTACECEFRWDVVIVWVLMKWNIFKVTLRVENEWYVRMEFHWEWVNDWWAMRNLLPFFDIKWRLTLEQTSHYTESVDFYWRDSC